MGVDTWYAFGPAVNEQAILSLTDDVVIDGLQAAGYRYIWLDGGWWGGARDADGNMAVDPAQWPHGMQWVAAYIHSKGLLAGIYTDAGSNGCGGGNEGSYDHYQQDVDTFATWGFDAIKLDNCGGTAMQADPRLLYGQFAQAIA
jgi:alpha-galactosidase